MNLRFHRRRDQQGYILLFLLLLLAVLAVGFLEAAKYDLQYTVQQIKRDREEEMIHRGVQYSRAIRKFYKKFGRYPTRIEELENTNRYRSLRKRYKDPITGKDFKLLHLQDVQMSFNPTPTGRTAVSEMDQQAGAPGALNGTGGAPNSAGPGSIGGTQSVPSDVTTTDQAVDTGNADQSGATPNAAAPGAMPQPLAQQLGPNGAPQVFGGGAIVGVASLSKDKTIREFNKKNHYNQWQFIYDPTMDRGGLLMTPNQPPLQGAFQTNQTNQTQPGQTPLPGQNPGLTNMPMAPQQPQNSQQQ